jgi:hypothetical protein
VVVGALLLVRPGHQRPPTPTEGGVLGRFTDPGNGPGAAVRETLVQTVPGPETRQSRAAERDPATPNKVSVVPTVTTLRAVARGSAPAFFFNVLLNGRTYFARVTGGPRPACVRPQSARASLGIRGPLGERSVRGSTYEDGVPLGVIRCRGTYRLSVSVLDAHNHPYPPFGSATFIVR